MSELVSMAMRRSHPATWNRSKPLPACQVVNSSRFSQFNGRNLLDIIVGDSDTAHILKFDV